MEGWSWLVPIAHAPETFSVVQGQSRYGQARPNEAGWREAAHSESEAWPGWLCRELVG